jgi:PAS domain S-box-containing protein
MSNAQLPFPDEVTRLLLIFLQQTKEHAVICMDTQGVVNAWLGAAPDIFGYTPEEAIGLSLKQIFTQEDRERKIDRYELEVAVSDCRSEDDRWHVRKDGTRIWATGAVSSLRDESGTLVGFVKVIRDRTDLRSHVEFLERNTDKLTNTQERMQLFFKTLGHELRNPLFPIQNAVEIVRRASASDPRVVSALNIISRQTGALIRLADDMMDLSRFETGKIDLKLKRMDLRRLLADAVTSLEHTANEKKLRLEAVMPLSELLVDIDESRFQRLILNLLGNAIKYTPQGGSIWVKAVQEGTEILVRVEDNGIGIAPDVLPRIFELFTQEKSASGIAPGGLGIGLAMVREIAELHGGSVQARSGGHGKGAEFTVRLPVKDAASESNV